METIERRKRARLKDILAADRCVMAGSVFDPISARIAEEAGFELGMLGGSLASFAVLGAPDLTLITLTELAEQTRRICRASSLPVMVDADHGYGNALNVMRTVAEISHAGAAALSIEDTALPRAFGSSVTPELISIEEGVGKMQAASAEARHTAMLVLARTNAVSIAGLEEGLKRLKAYETSGVDALFVPSLKTRGQLDRIARELSLPIVLAAPDAELLDVDYLASRRVRICFGGHQVFSAGVKALYDAALAIRAGTAPNLLPGMAEECLMARLTKRAENQDLDKFLKPQPKSLPDENF